ncbi:hypothetical protein PIGBHMHK_00674 [Mycoplasmopsis arginini]|nr:hypothetical protein [Mycoplasmopsis arginini]
MTDVVIEKIGDEFYIEGNHICTIKFSEIDPNPVISHYESISPIAWKRHYQLSHYRFCSLVLKNQKKHQHLFSHKYRKRRWLSKSNRITYGYARKTTSVAQDSTRGYKSIAVLSATMTSMYRKQMFGLWSWRKAT